MWECEDGTTFAGPTGHLTEKSPWEEASGSYLNRLQNNQRRITVLQSDVQVKEALFIRSTCAPQSRLRLKRPAQICTSGSRNMLQSTLAAICMSMYMMTGHYASVSLALRTQRNDSDFTQLSFKAKEITMRLGGKRAKTDKMRKRANIARASFHEARTQCNAGQAVSMGHIRFRGTALAEDGCTLLNAAVSTTQPLWRPVSC